jgi:hypothetical protein
MQSSKATQLRAAASKVNNVAVPTSTQPGAATKQKQARHIVSQTLPEKEWVNKMSYSQIG